MPCGRVVLPLIVVAVLAVLCAPAAAQMPDPRAMSGMAMPSPDLPDGTVTVRIVRGQITNNLPGVNVELHGGGDVRTAVTGNDGRATFSGVPSGSTVRARAVVDGEVLESRPFQVPPRGGIRTLLAASDTASSDATVPSTPPVSPTATGPLALGPSSRIAIEFSNDILQVFYLLEIVNRSDAAVSLNGPIVFALPEGALGATVMDGSTRQAVAERDRVILTGDVSPGVTELQIAFRLQPGGDTLTLRQAFPIPADMVLLAVQKVGDMRVTSPQLTRMQEAPIQRSTFIVASGPALPAGTPLVVTVTGLPHHSRVPLWVALALVFLIAGIGTWLAIDRGAAAPEIRRRALEEQRDRGLAALTALETERRSGRLDQRTFEERRRPLVAALEQVYGELDAAEEPASADRGAAA